MNLIDDLTLAVGPVKKAFESLEIRYFVGGSVASSYHGATRSTMDVDLVAEIDSTQVGQFVSLIGSDFYASEVAIQDAVERKSCFNLIHNSTSFKVDIFVSRRRPFDLDSMARAVNGELGLENKIEIPIASPEDVIVSKLEWYRLGNESSERQWDDIRRVLRLLGAATDQDYVANAAEAVGVVDLWKKLVDEVERIK